MTTSAEHFTNTERAFLGGFALSAIGTGFALPFLTVYFTTVVQVSRGEVSLVLVAISLTNLIVNSLAFVRPVRNPVKLLTAGLFVQGAGWMLLGVTDEYAIALAATVLIGCGEGMFFSSQMPSVTAIYDEERISKFFGFQYRIANAGIALGAFVVFLGADRLGSGVLHVLLIGNGISFTVFGVLCVALSTRVERPSGHHQTLALREVALVLRDRAFAAVLVLQVLWVALVLGPLETVLPLLMQGAGLTVSEISVMYVVNPLVVVLVGGLSVARIKRTGVRRPLLEGFIVAAGAAAILTTSDAVGLVHVLWVFVAYVVVLGVGESLVGPTIPDACRLLTQPERSAQYGAAFSLAFNVGLLTGPPVLVALLAAPGGTSIVLSALVLGPLVCAVVVRSLPAQRVP